MLKKALALKVFMLKKALALKVREIHNFYITKLVAH
jgi:hypothetical protein